MFQFSSSASSEAKDSSSAKLDRFVKENQLHLAALVWGLRQEWGESPAFLGIDFNPQPHFVCCSQAAIEKLNCQLDNQIQELLGILYGHDPEREIAMIGISNNQIKLIYFQPETPPSDCFASLDIELDSLIQQLEGRLGELL